MLTDHVLVRPGEIALKGANRSWFEKLLRKNIQSVLEDEDHGKVRRRWGRYYIGPCADARRVAQRVAKVFGVHGTSPVACTESDKDRLIAASLEVVAAALAVRASHTPGSIRFRVRVKRAFKAFPIRSMPFAAELGALLLERFPDLTVDLSNPELELGVEIREEGSFLFLEKFAGAGGLPVGCEGRVLSLLSGGIDSPVASWLAMKRGCHVDFVHFDSKPFTGPGTLEKVKSLAKVLDSWQGHSRLFLAPFAETQIALKSLAKPSYRTVLYRRFMLRIADRLAREQRYQALVAGDSIGQVASQTLTNLCAVEDTVHEHPLLRPLLCYDKNETMDLARRIGTYEISIRPFEDCCTVFQPDSPATAARADLCNKLEGEVDIEGLVAAACDQTLILNRRDF